MSVLLFVLCAHWHVVLCSLGNDPPHSAEGGETWSSTSVVPSHGAFNLALSLGSHESTLPDMLSMLC